MTQITVEQVLEVTKTRRPAAERLAAYANQRAAGNSMAVTQKEMRISPTTASRYERWMVAFRKETGRDPLPGTTPDEREHRRANWRNRAMTGGTGT